MRSQAVITAIHFAHGQPKPQRLPLEVLIAKLVEIDVGTFYLRKLPECRRRIPGDSLKQATKVSAFQKP